MVFCYKIITESPRPSGYVFPRKRSQISRKFDMPTTLSTLIDTFDHDAYGNAILDAIPERDWRLLTALARKREEEEEREKLAEQFRKLWQKEKEEKKMVEAETMDQYKQYLNEKRRYEHTWLEEKRAHRALEQQMKKGQILDGIRHKERRSAKLLAWNDDMKMSNLIDKVIVDEARAQLAADRRLRIGAADELRRRIGLAHAETQVNDARKRRNALLKNTSKRVAITNALSAWDTCLVRQEVSALECAQRAGYAARAAWAEARGAGVARARERRRGRARSAAALAARLRDCLRAGRG